MVKAIASFSGTGSRRSENTDSELPSYDHIPTDILTQYASDRVDAGCASYIRSHVLECRECEGRLIAEVFHRLATLGVKQSSYKRREARIPFRGRAFLQKLSPLSLEQMNVQVEDTSADGYGLLTTTFLEPGTIVYLRNGTSDALGTVRHCNDVGDGTYKTGVHVQRRVKRTSALGPRRFDEGAGPRETTGADPENL